MYNMIGTHRIWYTVLNILLGGMALVAAVISFNRSSHPGAVYFYIIGLFSWLFALFLFILRPDEEVVRLSYLMSVGLLSVCSVDAAFSIWEHSWQSRFVPIFHFTASAFLPCVFVRCFAVFPAMKRFAKNSLFKRLVYVPGILLSIAMTVSYLSGNSYERSFFIVKISPLPLLVLNIFFVFGYSIVGHACLFHTWFFGVSKRQRNQAKWLFLGIGIGTIPLTFFVTIPSILGMEIPYGGFSAYTIVMIMLCYGIAILRHRLMDFELALSRSSVYAVVSAIMLAFYLVSSKVIGSFLSKTYPGSGTAIELLSILIIALLFAPMKQRIEEFIDKSFHRRRYDYRRTLLNLSEALSTVLKLEELGDILLSRLDDALQPEFVALLLREGTGYQVYKWVGDEGKLNEALADLDFKSIKDEPERLSEGRLYIPLFRKNNRMGAIIAGAKLSGNAYNVEDVSLMKTLSHQTSISIENAIIYERLRKRVGFMEDAYNRLIETFRRSHPGLPPPEKPELKEDIISELDMIAEALIKSSDKLRALDELKSQFLSNVSHELRTPLTSIKGYVDNLLDGVVGELDEKQRKYMERISQNCDRLVRMIIDLLNLSRIEAGKIEFNPVYLSLFPLVSELVFELTPIAEKKGVLLTFNCPSDTKLFADGDRLREVMINLLDNAIKFTPPDGRVLVYAEDKEAYVDISVEDTGIGIPPESLGDIFDRFHQVKKSGGLGIGLAIVKSFVELHGGKVSVSSETGKGSRFTVTLPRG